MTCHRYLLATLASALFAAPGLAQEADDGCLVDEAREAYGDVHRQITEQTREQIERENPSDDQDFTEVGCIGEFGLSGDLGIPGIEPPSVDPCSAVNDYIDNKLSGLNEALNDFEAPGGVDGGIDVGREDSAESDDSYYNQFMDYQDKLEQQADTINERADTVEEGSEFDEDINAGGGGGRR